MLLTNGKQSAPERKETMSIDDLVARMETWGAFTASGATVTTDTALQQVTVWACNRILSEAIGQLPVVVQRRESGRWVDATDHDALELLFEPNNFWTQHDLFSYLTVWSEMRGNGLLLKSADSRGKVRRLLPVNADDAQIKLEDDWTLSYQLSGALSGDYTSKKIFHLRNFGTSGAIGLSTIANCREAIGLALKTEEHGARLFQNGAKVGLAIEAPGELGETVYERLHSHITKHHSGAGNAHKTMILEGGATVKPIGMTSEDAQFLETRRFQKQEIASLYGIPLFLLNDTEKSTTWGTGLEQISKAFVRYTLAPRLSRLAQTLNRELIPSKERRVTRFVFNTDAFTLGEFKERMEGYKVAIDAGVLNPNEAREEEGRNAREGGDEYRQPLNIGTEGETENTDPSAGD